MTEWNKHYHWKTKGCTPWAKSYFREELIGVSKTGAAGEVKVDSMSSFEGDVELGNRKGKLITIYDCSLSLAWSGTTKDGAQANGTITFPEVSHEVEDEGEEYRFETEMASASSDATRALYEIVRKELAPSLLPTFHAFRATLIETHAKDLGHQNSPSGSGASTPASAPDPAKASTSAAPPPNAKKAGTVSTSSSDVRVSSQLAISQTDLWDLLTNPARIPMWSRAPAQFSLEPHASFHLFGGGVLGSIQSVKAPSQLVQKWRTATWPEGHHGVLTTTLTQSDDSTRLELTLSGVPVGEEDQAEQGLETYYMRGLKSMGLGTIL